MGRRGMFGAVDILGLALAALLGGGAYAFRRIAIAPFSMVGICAGAQHPAICAPRHLVLMGAYLGIFGWAALALGLLAFFSNLRLAGALALGLGIAAVVNYDGTQGIIGAALGLIAWLTAATRSVRTPP